MKLNRLLEIAAERAMCDLCADCGGSACVACPRAKGVALAELREYHSAVYATLRRTAEHDKAMEAVRLVELPCKVGSFVFVSPNHGKSFHKAKLYGRNEKGSHLVQLCDDLLEENEKHIVASPLSRIFYDWFFTVYTRQEAEAALHGGGEGG